MTKIRELITNLITLFFFFWTLVAAFAPFLEYEVFSHLGLRFWEAENSIM
tara:strand:+ start:298 stop:447 length:150 start_codon:yes stop_codon:yes gene_type:complete